VPDKVPPVEIEAEIVDCAECGVPIKTLWVKNNGLIPSEDYLLIADWIFHPDCWSKSVEGYLAEEEQRVIKKSLLRSTRLIERG
jgi:hypothetical protein